MVVVLIIFALSGAAIASGVVYAVVNYVKCSKQLSRSEKNYHNKRTQTLIDISTTCKALNNADNDATKQKLLEELRGIRKWIEKYY